MDMNDKDLEQILLETLRISRENRDHLIKIERRQRWSRNWTIFYWCFLIILAGTGYYFAFPYFKTIRDEFTSVVGQVGEFTGISNHASAGSAAAAR